MSALQARTLFALMVLKLSHGEEGGTASENLMGQLGLVGVLDLVVLLLGVVCDEGCQHMQGTE